jgi:hypothetical protein
MAFAGLVAACSSPQPEPRTFFFFMEDGIAREGVLARCNRDRDATAEDEECNNARRAASALAVEQERGRRAALDAESERKLLAMRARADREAEMQRQAEAAAREAERQAYEDQWREPSPPAFEIAAVTPPASDVIIAAPELDLEELATIPRPFHPTGVPQ